MSEPAPATDEGNAGGRFFGVLLMAVGSLIAGLSGLCSAGVLVMMAAEPGSGSGEAIVGAFVGGLVMVGIVGGVPILVGVGLIIVGRGLYRSSKPKRIPETFS